MFKVNKNNKFRGDPLFHAFFRRQGNIHHAKAKDDYHNLDLLQKCKDNQMRI